MKILSEKEELGIGSTDGCVRGYRDSKAKKKNKPKPKAVKMWGQLEQSASLSFDRQNFVNIFISSY